VATPITFISWDNSRGPPTEKPQYYLAAFRSHSLHEFLRKFGGGSATRIAGLGGSVGITVGTGDTP